MAETREAKEKKVKHRPVHELIKEVLKEDWKNIRPFAELYKRGAIVPRKEIPVLIRAFQNAKNSFCRHYYEKVFESGRKNISKITKEAIATLKQQLAEAEKEKEEEIPIQ